MMKVPVDITYPGHPPGSPLRLEGRDLFLDPMKTPVHSLLPALEARYGEGVRGLHIVHEQTLRENHRMVQEAFRTAYPGEFMEAWAAKSFHTRALFAIARSERAGVDVGSLQELAMALDVGIDGTRIICTGPAKDGTELETIARCGATAVLENLDEAEALDKISRRLGEKTPVGIRVNPGLPEKATHPTMFTAGLLSKFGFPLSAGYAFKAAKRLKEMSGLQLSMAHMHLGSQIASLKPYMIASKRLIAFATQIRDRLGLQVTRIDVGGGFAYPYVSASVQQALLRDGFDPGMSLSSPLTISDYACAIAQIVKEASQGELPQLVSEPGRYLVAGAVGTLGRVLAVRETPRNTSWVFTSISTKEFHQRLLAPGVLYQTTIPNRVNDPPVFPAAFGGELCFGGDLMTPPGVALLIPKPRRGDYVYFANTGAYSIYGASFAHGLPLMPILLVDRRGNSHVVREPTGTDPLKALDRLPEHLSRTTTS